MLWVGVISIIITVMLSYLGHPFVKRWISKVLHREIDWWFDTVRFLLIPISALLAVYAIVQTQSARKSAEESLHQAQQKVVMLDRRESLRQWAMVVPTGEIATNIMGTALKQTGAMSRRHQKIFVREESTIGSSGNRCGEQQYTDDLKALINDFPKVPYAYVIIDPKNWTTG